jgi:hypothetical protein
MSSADDRLEAFQWRLGESFAWRSRRGKVMGIGTSIDLGTDERIRTVQYYPWTRTLRFETDAGDWFASGIGARRNPAPRRGRPVIYLDQNQWSTISKAIHAPHRVGSAAERTAAIQLAVMAFQGKVLLPYSAAHVSETAAWSNDAGRYELGLTILACSGGWQMRDPLAVRAAEFRKAIADHVGMQALPSPSVFTLEPYAALRVSQNERVIPDEVPKQWVYPYTATLATAVTVACILDRRPVRRGDLSGWVGRVTRFATWLESERDRSAAQKRRSAQAFMFGDSTTEIATAAASVGASPEQMSQWIRDTWDDTSIGAPAISMFRSAMVDKFLAGGRWESNDLTDLIYLCTAAAYADYVVGERSAVGLLSQSVRRLDAPVSLHRRIGSLIADLRGRGIEPAP